MLTISVPKYYIQYPLLIILGVTGLGLGGFVEPRPSSLCLWAWTWGLGGFALLIILGLVNS